MVTIRIAAACILILSLGGCLADNCQWEPIGASIHAPLVPPPDAGAIGQCGEWIKIDDVPWTLSEYTLAFDEADLEPIGEADEASRHVPPLGGPTIYKIAGIDPDEAVAIEAADGTFLLFTKGGGGSGILPPELCPLLSSENREVPQACDGASRP